jgi:hypothetical protein
MRLFLIFDIFYNLIDVGKGNAKARLYAVPGESIILS